MKYDIQQLIGNTLRWGVSTACLIALIGGGIYLYLHGSEPVPDYTHFDYHEAFRQTQYTTLSGIFGGLTSLNAQSWIRFGVVVLILTPILRVLLSLVDFLAEHDWLYALITSIVLGIIISNSIGGF